MSDKLALAQTRKLEIGKSITELRKKFTEQGDKWLDETQRSNFTKASEDYAAVKREIEELQSIADVHQRAAEVEEDEKRRSSTPNPKTGKRPEDTDPLGRAGEVDAPPTEEERALALQAWCRAQEGMPLKKRHAAAAKKCKLNPRAKTLPIPLLRTEQLRKMQGAFRSSHPTVAEQRALSSITGAAGGYTVPQGFMAALEINMLAYGGILQVAEILRTESGNDLPWPTADDTSNEGALVGENLTVDGSTDPTFGAVVFHAYKGHSKMTKVPAELFEDSAFDMASVLGAMHGERLGRLQNRQGTIGTGAGAPTGIVTTATLGVTAASATAIAADEVIQLIHSVDPAYRSDAAFMAHDAVWLHLQLLKDGNGQYLWQPGLQAGVPDRLRGYACFVNQIMASSVASAAKTLLFGQLKKHKVRQVRGIRMRRLVERYADLDQEGFISFIRFDSNTLDAGTAPIKYLLQA